MALHSSDHQSDTVNLAKNAGISAVGQIVFIITRFMVNIFITRTVGPESYGIFVLAMTIISFVEILALLGMENALVKFIAQFKALKDTPRLRGTIFCGVAMTLMTSTIIGIGLYSVADLLSRHVFHENNLIPVLRVMVILLPFSTVTLILLAAIQGLKLIKYKVLVQQIQTPLLRLFCVTLVIFMGYKLMGILWAYVVVAAGGTLLAGYYLTRHLRQILQKGPVIVESRKIFFFSTPILFTNIFNRIISGAGIMIIGYFFPASIVGVYGVAMRTIPLISMPLGAINVTFAPMISTLYTKDERDRLEHQFKVSMRYVLTMSLPIFVLLVFFSKQIMGLFGPGFVHGYKAMIILCIGQIVTVASGSVGFMLMMTGRPVANLINSGLLCIISILLYLFLIPRYGIIGAAWANVLAVTAIQLLRLVEVWHFLKMHPYCLDDLKPILSCILSLSVIMGLLYLGASRDHPLMILTMTMIFFACYIIFLFLFKLSPDDHVVLHKVKERFMK